METMKDDMSGAAAVAGVFKALAELKPNVEVRGYLAIAENMPGGRAQKPGDVLKTFNGKTVEVLNTDCRRPARFIRRLGLCGVQEAGCDHRYRRP